ncbi:type II secretion system F family protein [Phycicoccus sp. CSK15P-2]|uniref:type II secretion system F family protein n=1 Tax=Phycicoccus sp. CSK15P-2 TaxID=2807627 RepID=UPI00194E6ADD|nr:type II secretion system F family protein [Phycicoccus sp. CSK15P-2]MBM6404589.1 type II secretion system F family protein [Phycicoccus sp. CSK15P-2]
MTLAAVCAALAVLLWPVRRVGWRPVSRTASAAPSAASLDEAAVALTMLAAVLRGGAGAVESLEAVAEVDDSAAGRELAVVAAAHRWGEPPDRAWAHAGPGWAPAASAWHAALTAGAAPADLVESAAGRLRAAEARRVEAAAHRAGVLLVLPLGVCFLPGFVATTVVPVVLLLLGEL